MNPKHRGLLLLFLLGALLCGCFRKPTSEASAESSRPPLPIAFHRPQLPIAIHPHAHFCISSPQRTCSLGIDFAHWNSNSANWSQMSCGIDYTSYTLRIEYLGHGERGDRYHFTVYQPRSEKEERGHDPEIAKEGTFEYEGSEQMLYRQGEVSFGIKG